LTDDGALRDLVARTTILARVDPEQRRLVAAAP
jgi:hypothetical protein